MESALTADDLRPLLEKLAPEEQVRLARMALRAAAAQSAPRGYPAEPAAAEEFGSDENGLDWEAGGWEALDAPG